MTQPRESWTKLAVALEERIALIAPARRQRLALAEAVLHEYNTNRPFTLLDAGCGDGLLSLAWAARNPDWTVIGVDLRESLLAVARRRATSRSLGNVSFEAADLTQPLPRGDFDAVAAVECLTEIPDDRRALAMMAAALAPGGVLVLQVPDRDWVPVLSGSMATWREEVRHGYSATEITTMIREVGLEPIQVRSTYRSLVAAAQEIRDRIKRARLLIRLAAFPLMVAAVRLERLGITWGPPNAIFVVARRLTAVEQPEEQAS